MKTILKDLRHGVRILRRSPGFAAVAIAALAIGIGGVLPGDRRAAGHRARFHV